MGFYTQALNLYLNALKINPNYTNIYSEIGMCFDKLGKSNEAKRYYRKFLSAQPNDEKATNIMHRIENLRKLKPQKNDLTKAKLSLV